MTRPNPDIDPAISDWLSRIRAEYLEMPGLNLTLAQARRLWGLDELMSSALLDALVDTQFLRRTASGAYVRADARCNAR